MDATVGAAAAARWTNITVYRTTPMNYTGLTNMDSGDAGGDATFGLSQVRSAPPERSALLLPDAHPRYSLSTFQLLLPVMCPDVPNFQWCENRAYLSDGTAHMVYTEFVVAVREHTFGEYAACNPNATTGVFQCQHYDSMPPPQCKAGDFSLSDFDCFNGTKFRTVTVPGGDGGVGACCAACSAASDLAANRCVAWNMPTPTTCELLTDPVVEAPGLVGVKGGCVAAGIVDTDPDDQPLCWYEDARYNASAVYVRECDKSECVCALISDLAMGREGGAMCHHHSKPNSSSVLSARTKFFKPSTRARVSFLLYTVTFHANHAHNLTRSP